MAAYAVPAFNNVTEFLAFIAKVRGKYKRGGAFDIAAAAVCVLQDWNGGKIPFYTLPPKGPRQAQLSASIVQEWSREFDINECIRREESAALDAVVRPTDAGFARVTEVSGIAEEEFEDLDVLEADGVDQGDSGGDPPQDCTMSDDEQLSRGDSDGRYAIVRTRGTVDDTQPTFHAAPLRGASGRRDVSRGSHVTKSKMQVEQ
jgi:hypothetical protein